MGFMLVTSGSINPATGFFFLQPICSAAIFHPAACVFFVAVFFALFHSFMWQIAAEGRLGLATEQARLQLYRWERMGLMLVTSGSINSAAVFFLQPICSAAIFHPAACVIFAAVFWTVSFVHVAGCGR